MEHDKPRPSLAGYAVTQAIRQPRQLRLGRYRSGKKIIGVIIVFSAIIIGGGLLAWSLAHRPPALPGGLRRQVSFTTFVPTKLPAGYTVQKSSYSYQDGVLTYRVSAPNQVTVLVSEQPQPQSKDFDISSLHNTGLKAAKTTDTRYGTAHVGRFMNAEAGSLVAVGTWIFLSTPTDTTPNTLLTVIAHLSKTH